MSKNMSAKLLMLQGTGSSVGKSALVAGLCRLYRRRGVKVAPFKAQNMALNSFITRQGDEIGRAQAVQAEACGLDAHVDMNPVLIKPNSDTGAQVIVNGKPVSTMSATVYHNYKEIAWQAVSESLARLREKYELIIIEGAGSPAEINLRDKDIVNMGLATRVEAPVLLIGDIDKGGVFASLVGTMELLEDDEKELIRGFIVNKFRGDVTLLEPGLETITARCGVPFVGVVPWFGREIYLPEEDGVALDVELPQDSLKGRAGDDRQTLAIGVIRLPHISNFTDFDPLLHESQVRLDYLKPQAALAGYHLIILPGSKNTLEDMACLRDVGLVRRLQAFVEAGGAVVGICGGYQMLGQNLVDPEGVESGRGEIEGFGLLPVTTEMAPEKITVQCRAWLTASCFGSGQAVKGYEIHQGRTTLVGEAESLLQVTQSDGCQYADGFVADQGRVWGSYMHGIFDNDDFRTAYLNWLRKHVGRGGQVPDAAAGEISYRQRKEDGLNALADLLSASLDMKMIDELAGL
ncbi:MAG: cobyric acid synthase [Deltaproteobacteria bacterium]|nr:cobyric acid synthase [Candidatus Tharpella sp.]